MCHLWHSGHNQAFNASNNLPKVVGHLLFYQMSTLPGHGTEAPGGTIVEGVVGSHPVLQ
ncbi:hypothetical protein Hdeb2414_s0010g00352621 [Helianthus debilis subsp. tardiflorus]